MASIINQFRWLDVNSEDSAILDKFMDVMSVTDESFQKDMIVFLPEITVTDDQADRVGHFLLGKMEEDSAFTDTVIETVPSLCISNAVRNEITIKVLDHVPAVEVEELGKLVKFLLENCTEETYERVLVALRAQLHFVDTADPRRKIPDRKQKGKKTADVEKEIVLAIRSALRCKPEAIAFYNKLLKRLGASALGGAQLCVVDVWVLLVLLSFSGDQANHAQQTAHKKILSGQLSDSILAQSIGTHYNALKEFFAAILSFTCTLLKSKNATIARTGVSLYSLLFVTFQEMYQRQDILGELVAHLGSGNAEEVNGALASLTAIATDSLELLKPFASYLATLLDHIEMFDNNQTRELFWVISELIAPAPDSLAAHQHSRLEDEVHIMIRKQMSSDCQNHFKTGIIGSLALLGKTERLIESSSSPARCAKEVCDSLRRMFRQCSRNPVSLGFLFEELAQLLSQGRLTNEKVLEYLNGMVQEEFESIYIDEFQNGKLQEGELTTSYPMPSEAWFNLDDEDAQVAIRILPLSLSYDKEEQLQLAKLPAQICLMQTLEKRLSKSLEAINALLGCPLHLFAKECLDSSSQRKDVAQILGYAISWCREILNTFTDDLNFLDEQTLETESATIKKVIERAENIYFLETCLILLHQKAKEKRGKGVKSDAAAQPAAREHVLLLGMNQEVEKSAKYFSTKQFRPLRRSCFGILFLACSPGHGAIKDESALIPVWTYLLQALHHQCYSRDGIFRTSLDIVEFKTFEEEQIDFPFVLHTLQKSFLDHLASQDETSVPTAAAGPECLYDATSALVKDSCTAASFGLELISDITCDTIKKCNNVSNLCKFFDCFLGNGGGCDRANSITGFLNTVSAHYEKTSSFDLKFKSVQTIVSVYQKLQAEELDGGDQPGFDLEQIRHETFLKVNHLLIEVDPSSLSARKLSNARKARIIDQLIKSYSFLCEDPLESLHETMTFYERYAKSTLGKGKGSKMESPYPLLDRQSIMVWYSSLFHWLCKTFQKHLQESLEDTSELGKVHQCSALFTKLVLLPRKVEKGNLFLKHIVQNGQSFFDALAILDKNDLHKNDKVLPILKELQKGVKYIHTICVECKTQKNSFLASKVPALKRSVERFIWKCVLWLHKKEDVSVEMGSLKHRDLHGNVVLSQLDLSNFDFNQARDMYDNTSETETEKGTDSQRSLLLDQDLPLSYEC